MAEVRYRELRAEGRTLRSVVMRYGDRAPLPGIGVERFQAGAFSRYLRAGLDTVLNLMHDRTLRVGSTRDVLTLTHSPAELRIARTPATGRCLRLGAGAGR